VLAGGREEIFMDYVTKQMGTDACQVRNKIPMVSHDDYGDWLVLIKMVPEIVEFHRIGDRDILCEEPCPLCANGVHPIESRLFPVYNTNKDVVELLRVDAVCYPGSLSEQMCRLFHECKNARASVYCHAFFIKETGLIYGSQSEEKWKNRDGDVFIFRNWAVRFCQSICQKKEVVARFLNDYRPGAFKMSAGFCCGLD
jgi:hypothetical protein